MAVAAYAAVVSLMHVLGQIQQHPSRRRLHLVRDQTKALRIKVCFLQYFLEVHSQVLYEDLDGLARQIALVANEAEDIIDAHVVDQLSGGSLDKGLRFFCEGIDNVIEKIDSIKKELMKIKEGTTIQEQRPGVSDPSHSSVPPLIGNNTMVGFDERLVQIMDELTGDKCDLQVLPIVGMGGIGKTTLARNAFGNSYIMLHFDIRTWLTVSQEYSMQGILLGLLGKPGDQKYKESGENLAELGERLYKSLFDRRYLIVMDDVWSTNVWNDIKSFFPDNKNGSRIMVTSRLSNVAVSFSSSNPYSMDFLDKEKSWNLLCEKAFAKDGCPPELVEVGKSIAKSCKGLPLAIVVIGGLLSKSNMTREHWEFVAKDVNSFANSEDDEHCLKILSLSYNHLPIHLKPCFLYMRAFPEDDCKIPWEEMTIIGSLPNLEVLKLYDSAFTGPEWNPVEGEFQRLKLFLIECCNLVCWRAEKVHFPNLEHLELVSMRYLKEIPSGIGEIDTLRSIHLDLCTNSTVNSAREILEEQHSSGNEDLQLYVNCRLVLPGSG